MTTDAEPTLTPAEVLEHAARAVHKIDRQGQRGVTLVTEDEIVAMALLLVALAPALSNTPLTPPSTAGETP